MLKTRFALTLCLVALLGGCASTPPPTLALQAAEAAIRNAEQARVAEHAPVELGMARDKLTAANAAVQREEMTQGRRLAEQSRAEAELALARSEATRAKLVNDEMRSSTESLKQEMQRNTGAAQ